MSDHLDAPDFKSPNMNAKIDITDIFAFQNPDDVSKSVLVLNVNPMAPTLADHFDDLALYEIKVDNNHDAVEDLTFRFKFSTFYAGNQTVTVYKATGELATKMTASGEILFENLPVCFGSEAKIQSGNGYRFYVGMRSDPFFFDLAGFLDGGKFTGADTFIDKNVFSIVLEMPNEVLGKDSPVDIWARVLVPAGHKGHDHDAETAHAPAEDADLIQIDQMGRPLTNIIFMEGEDKNLFNLTLPADQTTLFAGKFCAKLMENGRTQTESEQLTRELLPDVLRYDYTRSASFPNGRLLSDDIIDAVLTLVKNTPVSDKVGAHTDLLAAFPYLGNPHM